MKLKLFPVVLLVTTAGSCPLRTEGYVCTADFRLGLSVRVKDSATVAWAASGSRLITVDQHGVVVDSGSGYWAAIPANRPDLDSTGLGGAGEHPGTFRVTVRKPGYKDWVRSGVQVTADKCHVRRTELTALLQAE
jgi:hypothetical protein